MMYGKIITISSKSDAKHAVQAHRLYRQGVESVNIKARDVLNNHQAL